MKRLIFAGCLFLLASAAPAQAQDKEPFQPTDVFRLEYAADPQISPDGKRVVYLRTFMDVMKDRRRSNLWIINVDGSDHRPLTSGDSNERTPRWSPDSNRLLYLAGDGELMCRWLDTGNVGRLARLPAEPLGIAWSPDGKSIAFTMHVAEKPKAFVQLPAPPKGAEWAEPPVMIQALNYRFDGKGYLKPGHHHLFVLPADGGTPRQLTSGPHEHVGVPAWTPDGKALLVAGNRHPEGEYDALNTEIYEVTVADGSIKALTKRKGPDNNPVVSPDGREIAYTGFDDKHQGYQVTRLYVMNRDGSESRLFSTPFAGRPDYDVKNPLWSKNGELFYQADHEGDTQIISNDFPDVRVRNVGGTTLDRPYASGSYSVSNDGTIAFTQTSPSHPAEVAVCSPRNKKAETRRLTFLSASLLSQRKLASVEEIKFKSSHDGRMIHGWIVKPAGFDVKKKYPLILEIHGGPFANYGPRFAAQMQLFAAAGYVVFYCNPRGSTSYGQEFGNLIHHAYPGHDYDDLMSGVDAVLALGHVDKDNLFVTGGSGGGVLTSWIIGKTGRFRAAVVSKPVINWFSFVLSADVYAFFNRYWFPGPPWENLEHYMKRSPISLAGNITTPTMIITGEADHRTPIAESEQLYQALKLRKIDAALVRIPGASHDFAARPSHLIAHSLYVLQWFETHRKK